MQTLACVKELALKASLGWTEGGVRGYYWLYWYERQLSFTKFHIFRLICRLWIIWIKGCPLWLLLKLSWCFRRRNESLELATLRSPRLCESRASCCSRSLLFISSEYWPSAALSTCCLLPPHPASKVFFPAPRRAVIIPSWNPHRQAHCHICVCGQHTLVREQRELYELTHVRYYATIICRLPEHRSYSPVNNWRIQTFCIRHFKRKRRERWQFKNWCNLKNFAIDYGITPLNFLLD